MPLMPLAALLMRSTHCPFVLQGGKPWISEMYGYSFACAKSNVWHTWDTQVMHYPTYSPQGKPLWVKGQCSIPFPGNTFRL